MKENPFVSIIVPVYKAEKCLARCIDSILQQSFKDWELLLVDDGSPDNSGALCDEYAIIDTRIKVFHKDNGGVSSARNLGLAHARGEYITFIDADDYVSGDYLEKLVACTPVDLVICGFKNEGETTFQPESIRVDALECSPLLTSLFEIPYYLDTPWCKLYKKSIIDDNNLKFDRLLKLSEDTLFSYNYIYYCNSIQIIADVLYTYDGRWGGGSKYRLSYDELSHILKVVVGAIDAVNHRFGSAIETKYKSFHVSKLIGLFPEYTDHQIYNLYHQYHPTMTEADFLGDYRLSPLVVGVLKAQDIVRNLNKEETIKFLIVLYDFNTVPISKIHFQSQKHQFFFWVLKCLGPKSAYWLLRIYS